MKGEKRYRGIFLRTLAAFLSVWLIMAGVLTLHTPITVMDLNSQPRKITIQIAFVYGPDGEVIEFIKQIVKKI